MKRGRWGKAEEEKRGKEEWREAGVHGREETERGRLRREKKKGNKMKW